MGYIWKDGQWEAALSTVCEPVVYHYEGYPPLRWCLWWIERAIADAWHKQVCSEINAAIQARKARRKER